jgi:hypothetical protein
MTKFKRIKAGELAAILLQNPEQYVVVEDQECCLVAHDSIAVTQVNHEHLGPCVNLIVLPPAERKPNFQYRAEEATPKAQCLSFTAGDDSEKILTPYKYRSLPCTNSTHSVCGTDKLSGQGVLEWCSTLLDAQIMFDRMSEYAQFENLTIRCNLDTNMDEEVKQQPVPPGHHVRLRWSSLGAGS